MEAWRLKIEPCRGPVNRWWLTMMRRGSGPGVLTTEAWRLKMEQWRASRPVVADSHYYDEEQDPDTHQHQSCKLDPDTASK